MKHASCLLALVLLVGCGGTGARSSEPAAPATSTTSATSDAAADPHGGPLQSHETADLAALLVTVPGYRYVDVSPEEEEASIRRLHRGEEQIVDGWFARVSFHGIVADDPALNSAQNADGDFEVGYLVLVQTAEAIPATLVGDTRFAAQMLDVADDDLERLDLAGVVVHRAEQPDLENSRFAYTWVHHGVVAHLDGAVADHLEDWLRAYLEIEPLGARETAELIGRLRPVEGFVYVDAIDLEPFGAAVDRVSGGAARTMHLVSSPDGAVGTFLLVASTDPTGPAFAVQLADELGVRLERMSTRTVGDVVLAEIAFEESGLECVIDVWVADGVTSIFARSAGGAEGERFVSEVLPEP